LELSGAASLSRLPRTCLVKIQAVYPTLKKAERRAADLLLADSGAITGATIVEAARLAGCSETTWVRLSQRLGYGGFLTLKASLAGRLRGDDALDEPAIVSFYDDVGPDTPSLEIARRVLDSSVNALNDTFRLIDEEKYDRAVRALSGASKVVLCGAGDAYAVVRSAYQKFFRAGLNVYANSDIDLQLIAIGNLRAGDVLLAVSYSGRTRSVLEQVKYARQKGCTVLAVTNFPVSPLTKNADIALLTAAFTKHARGEIVSKRVAQLFLIESLYVNLLMKSRADLSHNIQRADESIGVNKL
jgi:DNA-binding MurR/RpiR family transcriptional regulator